MIKITTLAVAAIASVVLATGHASAARLVSGGPQLVVKKYPIPQLNVRVHPRIPKICMNPLLKGPGARKCG